MLPNGSFQFIYQISIDDEIVHSVENNRPSSFDNVKVYAGNPWYKPLLGRIRNLLIDEYQEGVEQEGM